MHGYTIVVLFTILLNQCRKGNYTHDYCTTIKNKYEHKWKSDSKSLTLNGVAQEREFMWAW
jgi:hypothetical protein